MMSKALLKRIAIATVGSLMMTGVAYADLISGEISIVGGFTTTGGTDLSDATGLHFTGGDDDSGSFYVVSTYGDDFDGLLGTTGTIYDFDFDSITSEGFTLWTIGEFTFTLESLSVDDQSLTDLDLSGTGYLSYDGYEDTYGEWNFSGNTVTGQTFSWSSTTSANEVPEPATMLLFGTGIAGLAASNRRKKNVSL
jgi:hypothetical protein